MATKRVSKFASDWAFLGSIVSKYNQPTFQAFRAKSESYLTKVLSLPAEPPKIDWEFYKKNLNPEFVSQLENTYKSYVVPYPKESLKSAIDDQEKQQVERGKQACKESDARIELSKKQLSKWKDVIPLERLHLEEIHDAFPDHVVNLWEKPTFSPHNYEFDPHPRNVPGIHPGGGESH